MKYEIYNNSGEKEQIIELRLIKASHSDEIVLQARQRSCDTSIIGWTNIMNFKPNEYILKYRNVPVGLGFILDNTGTVLFKGDN